MTRNPISSKSGQSFSLLIESGSVEKCAHIFLSIRSSKTRSIRMNGDVNSKSNSRRNRNILDQIHLLTIEMHAINMIALTPAIQ